MSKLKEMLHTIPSDALGYEAVFKVTRMPKEVKDLRILSIGEGGSDSIDRLLELGADAYAIDPKYTNVPEMVDEISIRLFHNGRDEAPLDRFVQSVTINPDRYIAASSDKLPFSDGHFDLVYSVNSLMGYLDLDRSFLTAVMAESARVVKPGGSLRFYPFKGKDFHHHQQDELRQKNGDFIFNSLEHDQRIAKVKTYQVENDANKMLLIEKA